MRRGCENEREMHWRDHAMRASPRARLAREEPRRVFYARRISKDVANVGAENASGETEGRRDEVRVSRA